MISRRDFLSSAAIALAASRVSSSALDHAFEDSNPPPVPGKEGMILRSYRFLDLEMPVDFMNTWITPEPHFYVRNHMHMPGKIEAASWKLSIEGEVEHRV